MTETEENDLVLISHRNDNQNSNNNNNNVKCQNFKARYYLMYCYCVELLPQFIIGSQLVYATVALPLYLKDSSPIPMDKDQGSWFVSLLTIFLVLGSLSSTLLTSHPKLGRIGAQLMSAFVVIVGIVCLQFAKKPSELFLGRILCGIGSGLLYPASYLFLHELALPGHRAILAACNVLMLNVGSLYFLAIGWLLGLKWLPMSVLVPTAVYCIGITFVPESPVFLIQNGQESKAKRNLTLLWRCEESVREEFSSLRKKLNPALQSQTGGVSPLLTWPNIKAIAKCSTIMLFLSLSGCDTIYSYSIVITDMTQIGMGGNLFSVILEAMFILGFLVAPYFLRKCRRKIHYHCTASVAAICIFLMAIGVSRKELKDFTAEWIFSYLPIASAFLYAFLYGSGFGSIPFPLLGELLPEPARNAGTSISIFVRYFSVFLLLKMFPLMTDILGLNGLFIYHGFCILAGMKFLHLFVEETNAKQM